LRSFQALKINSRGASKVRVISRVRLLGFGVSWLPS
jgi:hypothetical protein